MLNYRLKNYIINYIKKEPHDNIRKDYVENLIYESRYIEIKSISDFMEIIEEKEVLRRGIYEIFESLPRYKGYDLKEVEIIENYKTLKIGIVLKYK